MQSFSVFLSGSEVMIINCSDPLLSCCLRSPCYRVYEGVAIMIEGHVEFLAKSWNSEETVGTTANFY